jgi:hypothetical protein
MEVVFETLEELYQRIKPALTTKKEEMRRNGYVYIKEEDIWNYLKEVKWVNSKNLSLYQMTCDILDTNDLAIDEYLRKKLNLKNRKVYFEER